MNVAGIVLACLETVTMSKKYKIGYICGFFDILHDGHIEILGKAKEQCDQLIVAVGTDEFMMSRKNRTSVLTFEQRANILSAIRYVDQVVPAHDLNKIAAFHRYHFDVMFAGDDHEIEPIYVEMVVRLKELGVDTVYFPRNRKVSSTELIKRCKQINFENLSDTQCDS